MARTSIGVQEAPFQGAIANLIMSPADAANGMMFPNDGRTALVIRNADAAQKTVTIRAVPDEAGRSVDLAVTVAAGAIAFIPPLRQGWWNQMSGADSGQVYVDFSAATSTTIAAVRQNL